MGGKYLLYPVLVFHSNACNEKILGDAEGCI